MEVGFLWQGSVFSVSHVNFEIILSVKNVNSACSNEPFCPQNCGGQRVNGTRFSSITRVVPHLYNPTGVPCPFIHLLSTLSNPEIYNVVKLHT